MAVPRDAALDINLNTLQHFALVFRNQRGRHYVGYRRAGAGSYLHVPRRCQADPAYDPAQLPGAGALPLPVRASGEFFRQYLFAQDREELPFNRAQRAWVYRAAKNVDSTVAFGSTQPLNRPGTLFSSTAPFPAGGGYRALQRHHLWRGLCPPALYHHVVFNISAMSFGACRCRHPGASRGRSRRGSGSTPAKGAMSSFHLEGGCDLIFQIGTGQVWGQERGRRPEREKLREVAGHEQVKMFEIKLSQGAKPGKGGILPGVKVTEIIASTRGIPVGQDSLSPNRHPDIGCVDDLLDMIHRVREISGKPVGIKAVIGLAGWLDQLCERINERGLQYAPRLLLPSTAAMAAQGGPAEPDRQHGPAAAEQPRRWW